jgi:hypothetical protein
MTFDEWLRHGVEMKWALPVVCATHDGTPMSETELEVIDYGDDPCINIIRVCQPEEYDEIYNNTTAMKWRDE